MITERNTPASSTQTLLTLARKLESYILMASAVPNILILVSFAISRGRPILYLMLWQKGQFSGVYLTMLSIFLAI
jgi:hypothetical protein